MEGQLVKERIEKLGITLSEIARRLSISPQSLNERLSVKDIKVGTLAEIAIAAGKDLNYFLEGYEKDLPVNQSQEQHADAGPKRQRQSSAAIDFYQLLKAKDEIIEAQRKTIQLYERVMGGKSID